jgi:hypothetical protein
LNEGTAPRALPRDCVMDERTKKERREFVWRESRRMAQSGEYPDWDSIEGALRGKYPEAHQILDDRALRTELEQLCRTEQKQEHQRRPKAKPHRWWRWWPF